MLPFSKELKVISKILLPDETYHIKLQEELENKDKVKRHQPKYSEEDYKELIDDKILGILGG